LVEITVPANGRDNARANAGLVNWGQIKQVQVFERRVKMNSRGIQLNGRKAIALLLAVLILVLAAAPALAYAPEDGTKFQSPHPAVVMSTGYSFPSAGQGMRLASPAPVTMQQRPPFQRVQ
jgi:hypothetical protein